MTGFLYSSVVGVDHFGWFVEWRTRTGEQKAARQACQDEAKARSAAAQGYPPPDLDWQPQKRLPL